jgi:Holliday junction DNA helicase RuvB
MISGPMRSRFGVTHNLEFYSEAHLLDILNRSASLMKVQTQQSAESLMTIAKRSRGTPRIANRLLRRVRDYAQVKTAGHIDLSVVDQALALEGVDQQGLDELDRKYLKVIGEIYKGGPVGLEAIAATLGEDSGTLEDMVEPFLLQGGLVARTRKGRQLTHRGADHVGITWTGSESDGLFNNTDE